MTPAQRIELAEKSILIKNWFSERMNVATNNPPTGVMFDDKVGDWLERPDVRSFEADLFRRICIRVSYDATGI